MKNIKIIGLVKETESPENPGSLEKRVALIPEHVQRLVSSGVKMFVEKGAGEGVGFSDQEYIDAGATIQNGDEIYLDKEMIIKFKGASLENIEKMKPGTILFCMAHFASFPDRAKLLQDRKINVIAMEEILESPKFISDEIVISKRFVEEILIDEEYEYGELDMGILGYSDSMIGGIRRAGNRDPKSMVLYQKDVSIDEIRSLGETSIYLYDSREFDNKELISQLKDARCQLFDLKDYVEHRVPEAVQEYRRNHPPFEFGGRRIQCLHETGMAGARYGFKLYSESEKVTEACVLGYGNVGMGAIHECYDQGARVIHILGRTHTRPEVIAPFLENSKVIINGAEQPPKFRGKKYLIKSDYIGKEIKEGSVVIDLVGGSASNRSPVEDVVECTYLTDPHFKRDGVTFSALWGWPMMGMMKESAIKYSGQILEVLLTKERILQGLKHIPEGVKKGLVCGPF